MNKDTLVVRVQPYIATDDVYVLIPLKWWKHKHLAEGVKQAIEATINKETASSRPPEDEL